MPMKTLYVPEEGLEAWEQFGRAASEAKLSTSALLLILLRAYLDGKITVTRTATEVTSAEA